MKLYHGTNLIVEKPIIANRHKTLDFGTGFYTTPNEEQAQEFACKVFERRGRNSAAIVNVYEFDYAAAMRGLTVRNYLHPDEDWLKFVVHNRRYGRESDVTDLIIGPVANDDVFATITLYTIGELTIAEAIQRLKVKDLFSQYLFCNDKALSYLSFASAYEAGAQ
ncbi:MAG: DUF3990 domain-containing protein [Coriobacteriales bacterium]|jgi:hypothetical protein|nr:DUF3990 domain-containing protein [Coriobacteriales bacterium]